MTDNIAALIDRLRQVEREHLAFALCYEAANELERLTTPSPPEKIAGLIERLLKHPALTCEEAAAALSTLAQENARLRTPQTPPNFENILDGASKIKDRRITELEAECDTLRDSVDAVRAEYLQRYMNATSRIIELEALTKCDGCGNSFDENGGICEPCHSASIAGHIKPLGARISELKAERNKAVIVADEMWVAREQIRAEHDAVRALNASLLAHNGALLRDIGNPAAIRAKTFKECAQVAKLFEDAHDAEIGSSQNPTAMLVQGRQSQVARDIAEAIRALAHASTPFDKSSGAQQDERIESDDNLPTAEDVRGILK